MVGGRTNTARPGATALVLVMAAALVGCLPVEATSPAFASDDFNRTVLGPEWTVVDHLGDGTVTLTGAGTPDARLELAVPAGESHDPWHTNRSLRVVRHAADTDFTAIVKFDGQPTQQYQTQGVLVQQDADNWLRFDVHHNGTRLRAFAASTAEATTTPRLQENTQAGATHWIRIARADDTWTLATSTNGEVWSTTGAFTHALDVTAVGPFVANAGNPAPAFTALVDYVFEASAPLEPEDISPSPTTTSTTSTSTTTTATTTTTTTTPDGPGPVIDVWDGDEQVVGSNGQTQLFYNLLGNVSDPDGVGALSYSLNGGAARPLAIGPDTRRLEAPGDFNADIPWDDLAPGVNEVVLTASDGAGNSSSRTVTVGRQDGSAPLPYSTDWASAARIGDQAQVVDGKWGIDGDTVRPLELGYDRLLMLGDIAWSDYEVTVPVTVHGLGPGHNSPSGGAALVGLALNWQGHTQTRNEQPFRYWYPTGAFAWYRWFEPTGKFELSGNDRTPAVRNQSWGLELGQTYIFKARSETVAGGVQYSWKIWAEGSPEPATWFLTILEDDGPATGSVGLIAHHADVQFGNVKVTPL